MKTNLRKKFRGGIHPSPNKQAREKEIESIRPGERVVIPLIQHIGAPCKPLVSKGDEVKKGQQIGEAGGYVSSPVHASVTGVVSSIQKFPHPLQGNVTSIEIEVEKGNQTTHYEKATNPRSLSVDELIENIQRAGIVGMGGAAFPTHVKLNPPEDKEVDTFILNGAECEPFLSADYRLMVEQTDEILAGAEILAKILGVENIFVGIEDNKPRAIQAFKEKAGKEFKIISLPTKYPQGWEKALIRAITGRKVPAGGLPLDIGVVVNNVGTAKAVHDAIYEGKPLIERVVTVGGKVNEPRNFSVPIGTPWSNLIEAAGGTADEATKLIGGGPMMGVTQHTDRVPVIKGTTGVVVLDREYGSPTKPRPCIQCARCVDVCPMNLLPTSIYKATKEKNTTKARNLHAMDCCECGSCAYVCPSSIPLVQWIKQAKGEIEMEQKEGEE